MKSFQHQDTETSSAVNHNIYKRTFLLLPVENQFVPYCWCLTPNFVCWLPLPSKQFKVQRRPHIVGRCINSTNIRWYVCASFTVGQYLCINRLFSLGTLDLFISQIFIFSFINFPSFLILLISVLWLANDWLSSHLSFLFFNPRLIFNVPFLLLLLYLLFFTFTLGLFSYLPFTITYFSIHWLLAINSSALLLDPSSSPFLTFFIRYWIWLIDTSTLRVFISCLYSFLRCLFHGAAKAVPHLPLILSSLWLILHSPVLFFPSVCIDVDAGRNLLARDVRIADVV